ncbi:hypothetical protein L7F22_060369 [Adiantum nelumboides]|nr:hypothetical protein [Adiantum nelumboides]
MQSDEVVPCAITFYIFALSLASALFFSSGAVRSNYLPVPSVVSLHREGSSPCLLKQSLRPERPVFAWFPNSSLKASLKETLITQRSQKSHLQREKSIPSSGAGLQQKTEFVDFSGISITSFYRYCKGGTSSGLQLCSSMGLTKTEINLRRLLSAMPQQTNQAKLAQYIVTLREQLALLTGESGQGNLPCISEERARDYAEQIEAAASRISTNEACGICFHPKMGF